MTDLTKITTPFGLLDLGTQEALRAWPHGWEIFYGQGWSSNAQPVWITTHTYRAKPAPKETTTTEAVYWSPEHPDLLEAGAIRGDTHRVTLRFTGYSPPVGEYPGPDGAAFTVEKL
jgi:hypothetical protein